MVLLLRKRKTRKKGEEWANNTLQDKLGKREGWIANLIANFAANFII
jgi:hypothetical protein